MASGVLRFLSRGRVLRRNLTIAAIVGSILSTVNQLDVIVEGNLTPRLVAKVIFNYLVPFTVASVSSYLNRNGR
jgi:Mg/Co/Ni transporter MgtE